MLTAGAACVMGRMSETFIGDKVLRVNDDGMVVEGMSMSRIGRWRVTRLGQAK
jgi:hypothetical protein